MAETTDAARPEPRWRSALRRHWLPCLGLVVFALVFYWRVTSALGSQWPNDLRDGASFAWNLWYFQEALGDGRNPFVTDLIFFPEGARLGFHTYVPLLGLLSWPLVALFGLPVAYSLVTLAGAALSGVATYALAHHLTRDRFVSAFAGVAYIVLPGRVLRMHGHVNLNQTQLLPLGILAVLLFYERPTRKRAVLLGAVTGLTFLLESIFAVFLVIGFLVVALLRWRATFTRLFLVRWAQAAAVGGILALPLLLAMVGELRAGELDPIPGWGGADSTSADLLSYVIPSGFHPIWGEVFVEPYGRIAAGERFTFPGFVVLLLAAAGFVLWRHRHKLVLAVMTATYFVFSLGPYLHVANQQGGLFSMKGQEFALPLPFLLLHVTPILNGVRIPARFMFMVNLLLAVFAAAGLACLVQVARRRFGERRLLGAGAALVAAAVLTLECLPGPLPAMASTEIPAPYEVLAAEPGDEAVLELPLQWRDGFGRIGDTVQARDYTAWMYYATEHGKPLVNGMVARYPDEREERLREEPVFAQILALQGDQAGPPATFDADDLADLGIGYVVAHRDPSVPDAFEYFGGLGLEILANDGDTLIWKVPGNPRRGSA